jgi:glycerol-3-phosphate dehydrogenase
MRAPWTRGSTLPGGDFSHDRREQLAADLASTFPFIDAAVVRRLAATYGTMARGILSGAATLGDLGVHFGHGLYEREVEHLVRNEWATSADDILWRRTKLGLRLSDAQRGGLADWLAAREPASSAA